MEMRLRLFKLLELRKSKHLSQSSLGEALSISQQSIDKYEKGKAEPDINMLKAIASYFDVSVDYLVGYSENPHSLSGITLNDLTVQEERVLRSIRALSPGAQDKLLAFLDELKDKD